MNTHALLIKAVENNIDWCNAVAQSHNLMTVRTDSLWYCEDPMPLLFPNAITRQGHALNNSLINDLLAPLNKPWFIKDSFNDYGRVESTFNLVFTAHWYGFMPQSIQRLPFDYPELDYVDSPAALKKWLNAWGTTEEHKKVFTEALLSSNLVSLVYLTEFGQITCGAALYRSQDVLGLSNLFGSTEEQQRLIRTIQVSYPDETLVGYGDDAELTLLKPFGFVELGKLSVLKATT